MNTIEAVSMIGKLHIMFGFQDKSQLHPNKIIAKPLKLMLQSVPARIVITILSSHVAKIISREKPVCKKLPISIRRWFVLSEGHSFTFLSFSDFSSSHSASSTFDAKHNRGDVLLS